MAEWLGKGLQNPLQRFDSAYRLQASQTAGVAELAYATDLKSVAGNGLWVRLPPPAPCFTEDAGVWVRLPFRHRPIFRVE